MSEPRNMEVEEQVLAGMMNSNKFLYEALSEAHEGMFTDSLREKLFQDILAASTKGEVTAKILKQKAQDKEKRHIQVIDGAWVDMEHSKKALHNLKDTYIKRQLYYSINDTLKRMSSETSDELIAGIEKDISSFYFDDTSENIIDPAERAGEALYEFYELLADPDKAKGIPFSVTNQNGFHKGFPTLDYALNGAGGGDLIIIAAKTGHGKTALAVSLARLFSLYQDYAGYYENAEMRIREMEARLLAPLARVDSNEILYAKLQGTKDEVEAKQTRISEAYERYRQSKLYLSRIPSLPLHKAKGLARQVKNRYKRLDYLIVDYVGRMSVEGRKNMQSWDEMYEIVKEMKELAMTLNIPVFVLAQLNDEGKLEGAKKMANEADGVLFLEPINEKDDKYLNKMFEERKRKMINYKISKFKVRRDDNPAPMYVNFDKRKQFINEVLQ